MNSKLLKRIGALIASGASAVAIALAMLHGSGGLEGRSHTPYKDIVGVLTVCDGHTGKDIVPGKRYTDAECDALTKSDLEHIAAQIDPYIKVKAKPQQLAAIYSFAYNVGPNAVIKSTLLKKLNDKDFSGACSELKKWVYAGGKKWQGLVNRRDTEYAICSWGNETK